MKQSRNFAVLSTLVFSGAFAGSVLGQSTWKGSANANWSNTANWSPATVPAEGVDLIIADATTNGLTLDGGISRSVGSLTFGNAGTRATNFTLTTQLNNGLTIAGGIVANGNFPNTPASLTMKGNYIVSADQTWAVAGSSDHSKDQGIFLREIGTGLNDRGALLLNANLTKEGPGQLLFAGATVDGPGDLIVNQGSLKFNAGANKVLIIGGPGSLIMNGSSVLSVYKNSGTMKISRPIVMNDISTLVTRVNACDLASPLTFNGTHNLDAPVVTNFTGEWSGAGTVNRTGSGTLTIASAANFTGELTLNAGTTIFEGDVGGFVTLNGGTLRTNGNIGTGLDVLGGTLQGEPLVNGELYLGTSTIVTDPLTPGSLETTGDLYFGGSITVRMASNPRSSAPFPILTYGGQLIGSVDDLTLTGNLDDYRSPSFSDATPGVITLSLASEHRTWNGGGYWDVNMSSSWLEGEKKFRQLDTVTFGDTGAGTVSMVGTLMPSSITVQNPSANYVFSAVTGGNIGGTADLVKEGAGNLDLGGENTFTGDITIKGGTLKPLASRSLGANGKTITVTDGGTLDINATIDDFRNYKAVIEGSGALGTGAIISSNITERLRGFATITLTNDAVIGGVGRWDLRPSIAGNAALNLGGHTLTKAGTNKIALVDGVMTDDGNVQILEGEFSFTRMVVEGAGSVSVDAGAVLRFENNASGSFNKEIVVDGGTVYTTGNPFTVSPGVSINDIAYFQCDVDLTVNGPVSGDGDLSKLGGGKLIVTGNATHSGETVISAGTLQFGNGGNTGFIDQDITNYGTFAFNRSDDVAFAKVISGTGGVANNGTGLLTFSAAQEFTGPVTVNSGVIKPVMENNFQADSPLLVGNAPGATFDLAGFSPQFRYLGDGGAVDGVVTNSGATPGTLTLNPEGADSITYGGVISGAVRVVVAGSKQAPSFTAPRQRLAGTLNTYTGGTVVDGGTLLARADGSLGAVPSSFDPANIVLQNNGTLVNEADIPELLDIHPNRGLTLGSGGGALCAGFNHSVYVRGVIRGAAGNDLTVLPNNGTLIFTGNNTYAGATILQPGNAARLRIGDGGTSGSLGTGPVVNDGQLTFNRSDEAVCTNAISGTGTLTQAGSGKLTLAGANSYSGNTNVSAGTLELGTAGSLGFFPGAMGVSNKITGTGTLVLNGTFLVDLTNADTTIGNTWTLVDTSLASTTYGTGFQVAGFANNGGVWKKKEGGRTWTYSQATGLLAVSESTGGGGFDDYMAGFGPLSDTSPTGDPDHDGLPNLLEYVLNGNPGVTDTSLLPTVDAAGDNLVFTFTRREDSAADTEQIFQYGSDLVGWTSLGITPPTAAQVSIGTVVDGLQKITVTIPKSAVSGGKLFGRLQVRAR